MTPEQYKKAAIRTENTPNFILKNRATVDGLHFDMRNDKRTADDLRLSRIMHAILGMITELGELCDPVKRHLVYNAPLDFNSNEKGSVREESGDLAWYHDGLFLDAIDAKLEDIWERNIAKLRARFPDKFTEDKAINRDLEAEGKALINSNLEGAELARVAQALGIGTPFVLSSSAQAIADACIARFQDVVRERRELQAAVDDIRKRLA